MKKVIVLLAFLLVAIPCQAEIIIVDPNGFGDFENIQDAINYSWHGDTIIVKPSTYSESIYFNGRAITLTSEDPNDPNIIKSTIVSSSSSSYTVVFDFGEGIGSILTGFTITTRGIYCYASSPTITKNIIRDCDNRGIYGQYNARPLILQNKIIQNSGRGIESCGGPITNNIITENEGGIAHCQGTISNNEIINNSIAPGDGAGLYYCGGTIANNVISSNYCNNVGGGLYECNGQIVDNLIAINYAGNGGGLRNCDGSITGNTILGNESQTVGGGLHYCDGNINNNIITGNKSGNFGGGLNNCRGSIYNNTIVGNIAYDAGAALYNCNTSVSKNIIAFNKANDIGGIYGLAGDPCDSTGDEPYPNGDRINQGAYGGTWQASKSPYGQTVYCDPKILGDVSNDCKVDFTDFVLLAVNWYRIENLEPNDSSIAQEWLARYDGSGSGTDWPLAMAIDESGNVYVTGESYGSDTDQDYATIKYCPDSNIPAWIKRYNGSWNKRDVARAITLDGLGNIIVTGLVLDSATKEDYVTIKYDPDGNEIWVATYNGPDDNQDEPYAVEVDDFNNIYVTGKSRDSSTYEDYATIKYNSDSNIPVWVARYNGPGNYDDGAKGIAVDSSGNVYVTGTSYGSGTSWDYATIKYSPDSNIPVWVARYNGPDNGADSATAIATDYVGNVYVTGTSAGYGTGVDYTTIKYSPDSNVPVWIVRYNGPAGSGYDNVRAMVVDTVGNVYVTGQSDGVGTDNDYATIKYDPNGTEVWVARYNGPDNDYEEAEDLAVDTAGNVYVTGRSKGSGTHYDFATVKYDPNGNEVWVERYNGPGDDWDVPHAMVVGASGNVYVTGNSIGSGTGSDYATIKYSAADYICTVEITGDLNNNCKVDFADLRTITDHWLECNLDPPEACWE